MTPNRRLFVDGKNMLLMGSSKYRESELPAIVQRILDIAMQHAMTFLVAEAHGACRSFQDYLAVKQYPQVIVGHARSVRYNAGNWPDIQYGDNLRERERNMIHDCSSAVVIWQDRSSVIAENLEHLKQQATPTYLVEYARAQGIVFSGMLDPNRVYRVFYLRQTRLASDEDASTNRD